MELTINDLSKEYGRKKAVNHFSVKLTNGIFSDMKTYFGMSQPVFMIILNVGLIFVFYRLTKNISKKHQVTG